MSLKDAHQKFLENFPEFYMSFSLFADCRPEHVRLYSDVKDETCLCCYCENIQLLLDGLSKYMTKKIKMREIMQLLCCDDNNYDCMTNNCNDCLDFLPKLKDKLMPCCDDEKFHYYSWQKEGNFYERKLASEISVKEALEKFEEDFKCYRKHKYISNTQKAILKEKREKLRDSEALIVMDFSEKFCSKARREIQASYFGKKLIQLFTAKIYTNAESYSFVIASDEQSQSKEVVYAYLKKIIAWLKDKNRNINHVIVFSDGCASQFKNKFNFLNLLHAQTDFGVTMEWHFFGTSHGKSECDGLGGTIKRGVHRRAQMFKFIQQKILSLLHWHLYKRQSLLK